MKIYVAGPLADVETVQAVQDAVVAAGHELALDWSRGNDVTFVGGYASRPDVSAGLAADDLNAVLAADAVLVVASEHDGRGMFVELGAALARACRGDLDHVSSSVRSDTRASSFITRSSSGHRPWMSGWPVSSDPTSDHRHDPARIAA